MKKIQFNIFLIFLFFINCNVSIGQSIDSLKLLLKNAKHDTTRCNVLNAMIEEEVDEKIWPIYNEKLLNLADKNLKTATTLKIFYSKHKANAINNIGFLAQQQGNMTKALEYYQKSLKIKEEINDKKGLADGLNNIGFVYKVWGNIPFALQYFHKSLKIQLEINDKQGAALSLNNVGGIYINQGNIPKALEYFHKSLKIQAEIKDSFGMARSLHNIASVYNNQGDIPMALEYNHKSLKIQEQIKDNKGIAYSLTNIGSIYQNQGDIPKALEYFYKGLKIREEIQDHQGIAYSLTSVGSVYQNQGNISKALEYYRKSLKIQEEIKDDYGIGHSLNNIGFLVQQQGKINEALEYYHKSLKIQEEIKDNYGMTRSLNNIGTILYKQGKDEEAVNYANRSLKVAKELGYPINIEFAAQTLNTIFKKQNKYKEALLMYELQIQMRDSVKSEENKKSSVKKQFQYQYEKKAAADSVRNSEEKKVKNALLATQQAQLKQEKTKSYALYGGLALVVLFAGFMVNRFKVTHKQKQIIELKEKETQRQNEIITQQKHLVEEKHKEITDSINYAERIQRSFLATKQLLDENLKNYFVFFQPKDVVSGDFYWATKLNNGNFALVTADSTGHGVPGAIMSLLNVTSLESAIKDGFTHPSDILNSTRKTIIDRLKKDGSAEGGKDGMDASLICFESPSPLEKGGGMRLTYAAANNPIWIVRTNAPFSLGEGRGDEVELIELAPDKMPVGKHDKDYEPFTQHTINLQKGDVVYALTDGMPDQFGGPNGKKFMYKKLKELLKSIAHLSMQEQKETLKKSLNTWKGDLEQVDDITLIGVRI